MIDLAIIAAILALLCLYLGYVLGKRLASTKAGRKIADLELRVVAGRDAVEACGDDLDRVKQDYARTLKGVKKKWTQRVAEAQKSYDAQVDELQMKQSVEVARQVKQIENSLMASYAAELQQVNVTLAGLREAEAEERARVPKTVPLKLKCEEATGDSRLDGVVEKVKEA